MSRIGKKPIEIPQGVEVKIDGNTVKVKGPKGELEQKIHPGIEIEVKDNSIEIKPKRNDSAAIWGTFRMLLSNMVNGVSQGFEKKLIFEGVGYRASVSGSKLVLNLGYSHPIEMEAPEGISFNVDKNTIVISGIDKQLVGQVAANIREKRPPEPYKGKGIRYEDEIIRRKAGKKAVGSE
ncbi:MAG: 50S ribosomal protein L6 [Candidatus Portnoybacteria bacterium]|nr:50S ribosomal protein L6 [Candidatus Portnoybacteria bacterium]